MFRVDGSGFVTSDVSRLTSVETVREPVNFHI